MNKVKAFLKNEFEPPKVLKRKAYYLEILQAKHNKIDYEAWNSSIKSLKGIFGPNNNWPGEVSSLEHNLKDLENHYNEFIEGIAYTYSILESDEKCIGCLYIRPSKNIKFNTRVDFWFRDSHKENEKEFFEWLIFWLETQWGLKACYPGRSISWEDYFDPS